MTRRLLVLFLLIAVPLFVAAKRHRGKMVFKAIEIKGTIQKPEAMLFLSRAKFNYKMLDLRIDVKKKVKEAVKNDDAF